MISVEVHEKLLEVTSHLHAPALHEEAMYLACDNGEIFCIKEDSGQTDIQFKCNGQPSSLVFDEAKNCFYVGDMANQSVLAYTAGEEQTNVLVRDYEGVPLLGPHSLVLSKKSGNIYFTDSGAFGETSVQDRKVQ